MAHIHSALARYVLSPYSRHYFYFLANSLKRWRMLGRDRFRVERTAIVTVEFVEWRDRLSRLFPRFHQHQPCYFYYITLAAFSRVSLLANRHFDNGDRQERFKEYYFTVQCYARIVGRGSSQSYCFTLPDVDDDFLITMLDRFTQLLAPTCLVTRLKLDTLLRRK